MISAASPGRLSTSRVIRGSTSPTPTRHTGEGTPSARRVDPVLVSGMVDVRAVAVDQLVVGQGLDEPGRQLVGRLGVPVGGAPGTRDGRARGPERPPGHT